MMMFKSYQSIATSTSATAMHNGLAAFTLLLSVDHAHGMCLQKRCRNDVCMEIWRSCGSVSVEDILTLRNLRSFLETTWNHAFSNISNTFNNSRHTMCDIVWPVQLKTAKEFGSLHTQIWQSCSPPRGQRMDAKLTSIGLGHMHIIAQRCSGNAKGEYCNTFRFLLYASVLSILQISVFAIECHVPNIMHLILQIVQIVRVGCNKKTNTMTAIRSKSGPMFFFWADFESTPIQDQNI